MSRKTVSVALVRERVNYLLRNMSDSTVPMYLTHRDGSDLSPNQAYRLGAASILESVLHATGNYAGFGYMDVDHSSGTPVVHDETRRSYYLKG